MTSGCLAIRSRIPGIGISESISAKTSESLFVSRSVSKVCTSLNMPMVLPIFSAIETIAVTFGSRIRSPVFGSRIAFPSLPTQGRPLRAFTRDSSSRFQTRLFTSAAS